MTRPSDITPEIYEWAEIFCDEHIHTDDRELVARAFMAGQAAPAPRLGGMTKHQHDALTFIRSYIGRTGSSPSIQDICDGLSLASKSGAHRVVCELAERGFIERRPYRSRGISIIERVA